MKKKSVLILILINSVFVTLFPPNMVQANLLTNPSFDNDISGWTSPFGNISHSLNGFSKSGSIQVFTEDRGSPYYHNGYAQQQISVNPASPYFFRVVGKTNLTGATYWIHLQWLAGVSVAGNDWVPSVLPNGSWVIFNWSGLSPVTADSVLINIGIQHDNTSGFVFYDDVYFDMLPPPPLLPPLNVEFTPFINSYLGNSVMLDWTPHLPIDFNPNDWQLFFNGTVIDFSISYTRDVPVVRNISSFLTNPGIYIFTMIFTANHSINFLDQITGIGETTVSITPGATGAVSILTNLTDNGNYSGMIYTTVSTNVTSNITVRLDGLYYSQFFYTFFQTFPLNTSGYSNGWHTISFQAVDTSKPSNTGMRQYQIFFSNTITSGVLISTNLTQNGIYTGNIAVRVDTSVFSNISARIDSTVLAMEYFTNSIVFSLNTFDYWPSSWHTIYVNAQDTSNYTNTGFVQYSVYFNNNLSSGSVLIGTNLTQNGNYSGLISFWIQTNVTSNLTIKLDNFLLTTFYFTSFTTFTFDSTLFSDGPHNLTVDAVDTVAFYSGFVSYALFFDNNNPPPSPPSLTAMTNLTMNGNYSNVIIVEINASIISNVTIDIDSVRHSIYFNLSLFFVQINTSNFAEGLHTLEITVFDAQNASNYVYFYYQINFFKEIPPPPPNDSFELYTNLTNQGIYSGAVNVLISSNITISGMNVTLDNQFLGQFTNFNDTTFLLNTSNFSDGYHNVTFTAWNNQNDYVTRSYWISFNNTGNQPPLNGMINVSVSPINSSSVVFTEKTFVINVENNFSHNMDNVELQIIVFDDFRNPIFQQNINTSLAENSSFLQSFSLVFNQTGQYTFEITLFDDIDHPWTSFGTWTVLESQSSDTSSTNSISSIIISTTPGFDLLLSVIIIFSLMVIKRLKKK